MKRIKIRMWENVFIRLQSFRESDDVTADEILTFAPHQHIRASVTLLEQKIDQLTDSKYRSQDVVIQQAACLLEEKAP